MAEKLSEDKLPVDTEDFEAEMGPPTFGVPKMEPVASETKAKPRSTAGRSLDGSAFYSQMNSMEKPIPKQSS